MDEQQLQAAFSAGDEAALSAAIDRYGQSPLRYCHHILLKCWPSGSCRYLRPVAALLARRPHSLRRRRHGHSCPLGGRNRPLLLLRAGGPPPLLLGDAVRQAAYLYS